MRACRVENSKFESTRTDRAELLIPRLCCGGRGLRLLDRCLMLADDLVLRGKPGSGDALAGWYYLSNADLTQVIPPDLQSPFRCLSLSLAACRKVSLSGRLPLAETSAPYCLAPPTLLCECSIYGEPWRRLGVPSLL